uniref:Uncharacterized protein n=1 Tax=Rousettus aegyptiacus TaxID=9407 RepID=A0A7J8HTB0_ROUAE|nr:hypothetical protein HJG63_011071 [Rousettus aegyptiacus]
MILDADFIPFTKINSKRITGQNVKHDTAKLLEDFNAGGNLDDLGYGDDLLDTTPKARSVKERIEKLEFIKIKNFCSAKDNVKGPRRQATDWEKIFTEGTADKGLCVLSKTYRELSKLTSKKINNLIKKWAKDPNRHFIKKEVQLTNRCMKTCSTDMSSRKCKLKQ